MPIFASVFLALNEAGVPFLVIGGHAVVLHGHLRNTFDLDLLLADSALAGARSAVTNLGYRTYFETDAFLQLQAPENFPPLDLMIVDDQTFDRIEATANQKILDGQQIRIPDAIRLIALKLHATRDTARRTTETDWQDIVSLVTVTNRSLEDPELRLIIAQYGGPGALAEINRRIRNS
jgi:hypothetical protein